MRTSSSTLCCSRLSLETIKIWRQKCKISKATWRHSLIYRTISVLTVASRSTIMRLPSFRWHSSQVYRCQGLKPSTKRREIRICRAISTDYDARNKPELVGSRKRTKQVLTRPQMKVCPSNQSVSKSGRIGCLRSSISSCRSNLTTNLAQWHRIMGI